MYKFLISLSFLLTGCNGNGLGEQISKGLIEQQAIQTGEYCYTNKHSQRFCVKHMGVDKSTQQQEEAERDFQEMMEEWWLGIRFR